MYAWMMLTPLLVLISLFAFIPTLQTVWASLLTKGSSRRPPQFTGLDNYQDLLADPVFWQVLSNNFWYAITT